MVALSGEVDAKARMLQYRVIEARRESDLGFNPEEGSSGADATCPYCGTVADDVRVKSEGRAG